MKKLVITLVVLLCLLIAGDFAASSYAEREIAARAQSQLHLSAPPSVEINGFPFLTQAVQGDYRNVELASQGVPVGDLKHVGIEATLQEVHLPLSDVMHGQVNQVRIDHVTGRVRLTEKDIGQAIQIPDLKITPAPQEASANGGAGGAQSATPAHAVTHGGTKAPVQLSGTVNVAGVANRVSVVAVLSMVHGKIRISPHKLTASNSIIGNFPLPQALQRPILRHFSTTLDPGKLPLTVTPTALRVNDGSVAAEGTMSNVLLDRNGVHTR